MTASTNVIKYGVVVKCFRTLILRAYQDDKLIVGQMLDFSLIG